jgi:hypothetical protein
MGLNKLVQQFVEQLNDLNHYFLCFLEESPSILWHEAMVDTKIYIFEMSFEESVSYFKHSENLDKIKRTNGSSPASLPVDNKNLLPVV